MPAFLPCLLQHWTSPTGGRNSDRTSNSWADVRKDVVRNLEWLLNTEQLSTLAGHELPPAVRRSVLCYGIPAYSGQVQSAFKVEDVAWSIRERIIAFESRVEPASLTVKAAGPDRKGTFNRMRFAIHGYLRADPIPIEFLVQTELDMESGSATVIG